MKPRLRSGRPPGGTRAVYLRAPGRGIGPAWSLARARCGMQGERVNTEIADTIVARTLT